MFLIYRQKPNAPLELLDRAKNGAHAYFLLKQHSLRLGGPVISVETLADGTTIECCRFKD